MNEKEYVCAYNKYCLHHGEKVKASEAVVINNKRYHWDCAVMKQKIEECADTYMQYIEDKSQYPMILRIIKTLVYKNKVPVDYILRRIEYSKQYYSDKPVQALYGIRKIFWEKQFKL